VAVASLTLYSRKTRLLLLLLLLLFVILIAAAVVSILLLTCRRRCYFGAVCRCSSVGVVWAYWATVTKNGEMRFLLLRCCHAETVFTVPLESREKF